MGFFKKLFRKQYGKADGFNFKGVKSLTIEDNKVILYALGTEDYVLTKEKVKSIEPVTTNVQVSDFIQKGIIAVVNDYMVTLNDGTVGQITIFAGEAYKMLALLK